MRSPIRVLLCSYVSPLFLVLGRAGQRLNLPKDREGKDGSVDPVAEHPDVLEVELDWELTDLSREGVGVLHGSLMLEETVL